MNKIIDAERMNQCLRYVAELKKKIRTEPEVPMSGKVVRSWVR